MDSIYNNSNAFKQASAVTVALAGFAPVTTLPSVIVNASQGPSGLTYMAPEAAAEASIVATPHSLIFSTCPKSSSPFVVKPVTFLPSMMDFLVEESMMPGKIAPPWQLQTISPRICRKNKECTHTAEMIAPSLYISLAIFCSPVAVG